jgi:hypothetical protein
MGKRKSSDDSTQQLAQKRTRTRATFRVARSASHFTFTSTSLAGSRDAASRVTKLRQNANGRLGQRKTEKRARTPTDQPAQEEAGDDAAQPSAFDAVQDTSDSTTDVPVVAKPKRKRKRKNTTSVRVLFSYYIFVHHS